MEKAFVPVHQVNAKLPLSRLYLDEVRLAWQGVSNATDMMLCCVWSTFLLPVRHGGHSPPAGQCGNPAVP